MLLLFNINIVYIHVDTARSDPAAFHSAIFEINNSWKTSKNIFHIICAGR